MTTPDLKSRMQVLQKNIQPAEARLKHKGLLSADHRATWAQLLGRFKALSDKVQAEVASEEAHGHHVSGLEVSVRQWMDRLEIEMD